MFEVCEKVGFPVHNKKLFDFLVEQDLSKHDIVVLALQCPVKGVGGVVQLDSRKEIPTAELLKVMITGKLCFLNVAVKAADADQKRPKMLVLCERNKHCPGNLSQSQSSLSLISSCAKRADEGPWCSKLDRASHPRPGSFSLHCGSHALKSGCPPPHFVHSVRHSDCPGC